MVLFEIIASTVIVSLISFVGVVTLALKRKALDKALFIFVSLAAGAMIGGAFLHLIPEAIELNTAIDASMFVLSGFVLFFFVEKVLHWRHCHHGSHAHTFTYMALFGDAIHNFIDGLVLAAAYITSIPLGFATTMAIIFHEIPQEISDFGVLIYGGFKVKRALFYNFLVACVAVVGGIVGFFLASYSQGFESLLVPIAAGGFLYIAATDLIPEFREEESLSKSMLAMLVFVVGIAMMYVMRVLFLV